MLREFRVETDGNLLRLIRSRRPAVIRILLLLVAGAIAASVVTGWAVWLVALCGAPALLFAVADAARTVRRTLCRKGAFIKIGRLELPRDEVQPWLGARAGRRWPLGARVMVDGRVFCVPLIDVADGDEANALADALSRFLDRPLARS